MHIACRALWWLYQELFASWKLTRILFSTILAFVLLKDECDEKFDVQNTFWQNPITNDKRHWGENFIIWGIVCHQILNFFRPRITYPLIILDEKLSNPRFFWYLWFYWSLLATRFFNGMIYVSHTWKFWHLQIESFYKVIQRVLIWKWMLWSYETISIENCHWSNYQIAIHYKSFTLFKSMSKVA